MPQPQDDPSGAEAWPEDVQDTQPEHYDGDAGDRIADVLHGCVRGCTRARRHLDTCEDNDACSGCEPRRANHGLLCGPCHNRLAEWLRVAPMQHDLLVVMAAPTLEQILSDEPRGSLDGPPAPLSVHALAAAWDITDMLSGLVDFVCEVHGLTGPPRLRTGDSLVNPRKVSWSESLGEYFWTDPPPRYATARAAKWLTAQMERLEMLETIGDDWDALGLVMSLGHAVAPWRETSARLDGIPCPECHHMSLELFGGTVNVTCTNRKCKTEIAPRRYAIWARMYTEERAERTTA